MESREAGRRRRERRLVECVPNFSEGRDGSKVDAIVLAIARTADVVVLGREMDPDHNRAVVTFAGPPEAVAEAALAAIAQAVQSIDLRRHSGVHPRIGAADVLPFVPISGISMEECAALAHRVGEEIWRRLRVPVFFYEAAARSPERRRLENIRRNNAVGLTPDIGGPGLHPTAGAVAVGARKFLIAFNINLNTADVRVAREIARAVRESSGGLPCVKAMGVALASRNLAQVSMNLTDFERTPLPVAFEAVRAEAARRGVSIAGSELIGLLPRKALAGTTAAALQCGNLTSASLLENQLAKQTAEPPGGPLIQ
ncbi:MAG: glutamate formimidoyltransferase [Bryobacteraceae bacterium]